MCLFDQRWTKYNQLIKLPEYTYSLPEKGSWLPKAGDLQCILWWPEQCDVCRIVKDYLSKEPLNDFIESMYFKRYLQWKYLERYVVDSVYSEQFVIDIKRYLQWKYLERYVIDNVYSEWFVIDSSMYINCYLQLKFLDMYTINDMYFKHFLQLRKVYCTLWYNLTYFGA